jgi:hypothetical protein
MTDDNEIEFTKDQIGKDSAPNTMISPARWERANQDVDFKDLFEELTADGSMTSKYRSGSDQMGHCPFHGTDRTPSFDFFRKNNDGFCWGCPPKEQYYNNIIFVSKLLSINKVKALIYLEKHYNLPPIDDIVLDEDDDEEYTLTFDDLKEAYIRQAAKCVQLSQDPEMAEQYHRIYFEAEKIQDPVALAQVLDPDTLAEIKRRVSIRKP